MVEEKWKCDNVVAGAIVLVFNIAKPEILKKSSEIQTEYHDVVLSSQDFLLNEINRLQIVAVKGPSRRLTEVSEKLIGIKEFLQCCICQDHRISALLKYFIRKAAVVLRQYVSTSPAFVLRIYLANKFRDVCRRNRCFPGAREHEMDGMSGFLGRWIPVFVFFVGNGFRHNA